METSSYSLHARQSSSCSRETLDSRLTGDSLDRVTTLASRIEWVLEHTRRHDGSKWTARALSEEAGLGSPAHVGMIKRGEAKNVRSETIEAIAKACGVSFEWLATGRGAPTDTDDSQRHPPDEIDAAGRRPVAEDAARTSRPTFANLPDWADLLAGARAMQLERGREIPEWAFAAVATSSALLTAPPSAATIYDIARVYADHGIGKPRPPRAETGVVAKAKTEGG